MGVLMRDLLLFVCATATLPIWLTAVVWHLGWLAWKGGRVHGQRFMDWLVRE